MMRFSADVFIIGICIVLTTVLGFLGWSAYSSLGVPDDLNEVGDSVAGFASSLALIWIIASVFIQRNELTLMREEYESMRLSMEAQEAGLRVESTIQITRLYLDRLDELSAQFQQSASALFDRIGDNISEEIDPLLSYKFMALKFKALIQGGDPSKIEALERHAASIGSIVVQYSLIYSRMHVYLNAQRDTELVNSILIEDSKYARAINVINKYSRDDVSLIAKIFSVAEVGDEK